MTQTPLGIRHLLNFGSSGFDLDSEDVQEQIRRIRETDRKHLIDILARLHLDIPLDEAMEHYRDFAYLDSKEQECKTCNKGMDKMLSCYKPTVNYDEETGELSFPVQACPFSKNCRKQKAYQDALKGMMISHRFQSRTFDSFNVTPETQNIFNFTKQWAQSFQEHAKGLYIFGSYGSGKTHLAAAALIEIHRLYGVTGAFLTFSDFLAKLKACFNNDSKKFEETFQLYAKAPLLVLDDLGEERKDRNGRLSSWAGGQIFRLINYRYEFELTTIITSSIEPSKLAEALPRAVISRLFEMCFFLHDRAQDYRTKNLSIIE